MTSRPRPRGLPCGAVRGAPSTLAFALALACLLAPAAGHAADSSAKKAARPHYEKGASEYNLGHFVESIHEFEQAYELDRAPILLFNIAQAHRQNGNNERAAFFYRRYLEQAPTATNRAEVEKRIKDLDAVIQQQNDVKRRPPTEVTDQDQQTGAAPTTPPGATSPLAGATPAAPTETGSPIPAPMTGAPPESAISGANDEAGAETFHPIRVWASVGPAFPKFSGRDLQEPTVLSVRVGGGYTFDLGRAGLVDAGISGTYAPFQYRTTDAANANRNAGFWGLFATGTYRYRVAKLLELSGELGLGAVWWSGIGDANPFTADGTGASGPVPMPSLLVGVGAIYHLPRRFTLFAQPTFLFSKTTGDGLSSAVSSVSRFDLALGVGYSI